jgi:arylsulfatase A-like enzyme
MGYIDVFPTALRLAGAKPPAKAPPLDGLDMLDVMRGEKAAPERPWFSYIAPQTKEDVAVNVGAWKLVLSGGAVLGAGIDPATKVELYNIVDDPYEMKDGPRSIRNVARTATHREFRPDAKSGVAACAEDNFNFEGLADSTIESFT